MNVTIKEAIEKDYPAIIATLKEFAVFQKTPPEQVTNTAELMKEEKDFFTCFIAEDDEGNLMGLSTCFYAYYSWTGKSLYLDDLFVKPPYRKLGIGKRLLDAVIAFAKANNCKKIHWMVSNWNTNAIDFYIRCGASFYKEEFVCYMDEGAIGKYLQSQPVAS